MKLTRPVDRRRFLRGAGGACLTLPLLEAMGAGTDGLPPKRITATGIFYGMMPQYFHPQAVGRDYNMPRMLKPLESLRNEFTVFSGLDHNLTGGHNATKFFLSGIPTIEARGFEEANISMDQKAALHVGSETRYPSLTLGANADQQHALSWTRNGNAVQQLESLERLHRLLFRKTDAAERQRTEAQLSDKRSILDLVREQAHSFERDLGQADKEKLDQYFTSVRELEQRIEQSELWLNQAKPRTDYALPLGVDALPLYDRTPLYYDLITLALQTDSTRVVSLAFTGLGKEQGGIPGVSSNYHALSHHGQVPEVIEELARIERFHTQQFARFLTKLKAIEQSDGSSLLESTMALFGSGMSNANSHSNRDLPVLLAGGGFRHGEHKHYARVGRDSTPLCNLYLSMLQQFGLEIDTFNTSTGTLTGLEPA